MDIRNKTIVFFGDSITDTCKSINKEYPFGTGYVNMLRADLISDYGNDAPTIINEGISGNKTEDLLFRINDVIVHKPDIVFVYIGINDVWHPFEAGNIPNNKDILNRLKDIHNILSRKSKVIVIMPYLLPSDDFFKSLNPLFIKFRNDELEFLKLNNYNYIDLQFEFEKIIPNVENLLITKDSVHPTIFGHGYIAQIILNYLKNF